MNDRVDPGDAGTDRDANSISPLPGEAGIPNVAARPRGSMSKKGLLAVGLLILSLVAVSAFSIQRFSSSGKKSDDAESKRVSDRPTAATAEPRKLEMPSPPPASAPAPRIPALVPTAAEAAEPIGVRRPGQGSSGNGGPKSIPPEDAPVLLVSSRPGATASPSTPSTRRADLASATEPGQEVDPNDPISATSRNLQGYQRQLQGLLDSLTKTAVMATGQATGAARRIRRPPDRPQRSRPTGPRCHTPAGATLPDSSPWRYRSRGAAAARPGARHVDVHRRT